MSELQRKLEARIRKKEQEIQGLTSELEGLQQQARDVEIKISEARSFIEGMRASLDLANAGHPGGESKRQRRITLRHGSDAAKARELLKGIGHPLHISEILTLMERDDTRENRTSLGGAISHYVRKEMFFTRTAPNTFGLVEFDEENSEGGEVVSLEGRKNSV